MRYRSKAVICMILCLLLLAGCSAGKDKASEDGLSLDAVSEDEVITLNWWEDEYDLDPEFVFDPSKEFDDYTNREFFDYMFTGLKAVFIDFDSESFLQLVDHGGGLFSEYEYDYSNLNGIKVRIGEVYDIKFETIVEPYSNENYFVNTWKAYAKAFVIDGQALIPEGEQILYVELSIHEYDNKPVSNKFEVVCLGTLKSGELYTPYVNSGKYADPDYVSLGYKTFNYLVMPLSFEIPASPDDYFLHANIIHGYWRKVWEEKGDLIHTDPWTETPEDFLNFAEKYLCITDYFDREQFLSAMKEWEEYDSTTGIMEVFATGYYPSNIHILGIENPDSKTEILTIATYSEAFSLVPETVMQYTFDLRTDENGEGYAALRHKETMPFLKYAENGRVFK